MPKPIKESSIERGKKILTELKERGLTGKILINMMKQCCQDVPLKRFPEFLEKIGYKGE